MNREQFFQELRTALHREGFVPQPEQDELLPVEWDGLPLCRITADGSVRYWQEDVATPERERACERATDLACTVREYGLHRAGVHDAAGTGSAPASPKPDR